MSMWERQSRRILTPLTLVPYHRWMQFLPSQLSPSPSLPSSQLVNNNHNNHWYVNSGGAAGMWGVKTHHLITPTSTPPRDASWWGGASRPSASASVSPSSYADKNYESTSASRGGVGRGSREGSRENVRLTGTNFASVAINFTLTFIIERNGQVATLFVSAVLSNPHSIINLIQTPRTHSVAPSQPPLLPPHPLNSLHTPLSSSYQLDPNLARAKIFSLFNASISTKAFDNALRASSFTGYAPIHNSHPTYSITHCC